MKPWNRLSRLAGRILAGDDRRPKVDDAIFLGDEAYRNHQPRKAAAPHIRERHVGADLRRAKSVPEEAVAQKAARSRPGWWARLGIGRGAASAPESEYMRTRIVGTPHPASEPKKTQAMTTRKEDAAPRAPGLAGNAPAPALPAPALPAPALPVPPLVAPTRLAGSAVLDTAVASTRPAKKKLSDGDMLDNLFGKPEPVRRNEPVAPSEPIRARAPVVAVKKKKRMDRGDVTLAALGLTLGLTCAVFPWYIFFNQEKFGVREFTFSGGGSGRASPDMAYVPQPVGKPFAQSEMPRMELDFFPTATLPSDGESPRALPSSAQPFPSDRVNFRLVHVANGRAMIEDADGLWVVQRGSQLPDASRVTAIEQREGRWVLVTSHDKIVELAN